MARYGAYPKNQRLALLFLLLLTTVICRLMDGFSSAGASSAHVLAAATSLRAAVESEEKTTFRAVPEAFAFDPNTVSAEELRRLGLSEKQAKGWIKFRGDRTNAFRRPEDIGKLFVLTEKNKARLIPLAHVSEEKMKGAGTRVQSFVFDPNLVTTADLEKLGLSRKQAAAFVNYREASRYGKAFRKPEDIRRLNTLSERQKDHLVGLAVLPEEVAGEKAERVAAQRFRFDPNTISADSLALLGFPAWQTRSFAKYRGDRTNTFRGPEDLRRVGALDSALVESLLGLITIAPSAQSAAPASAPKTYSYSPKVPPPPIGGFDVNAADTTAWRSLPGIGAYRAKRIVRYRRALGGFHSLAQVGATRGLPDSTFQAILPYLNLDTPPRRIPINRASFDELKRHPDISRNLANSIVNNREKFGRFNGEADLRRLRLITDRNLPTLLPYISFE